MTREKQIRKSGKRLYFYSRRNRLFLLFFCLCQVTVFSQIYSGKDTEIFVSKSTVVSSGSPHDTLLNREKTKIFVTRHTVVKNLKETTSVEIIYLNTPSKESPKKQFAGKNINKKKERIQSIKSLEYTRPAVQIYNQQGSYFFSGGSSSNSIAVSPNRDFRKAYISDSRNEKPTFAEGKKSLTICHYRKTLKESAFKNIGTIRPPPGDIIFTEQPFKVVLYKTFILY